MTSQQELNKNKNSRKNCTCKKDVIYLIRRVSDDAKSSNRSAFSAVFIDSVPLELNKMQFDRNLQYLNRLFEVVSCSKSEKPNV